MSKLAYAPGVRIVIDTLTHGPIDVSDDIMRGRVSLKQIVSSLEVHLTNTGRKYDGVFTPNDGIVCYLKRIRWLPVFTGYLDDVPLLNAVAGNIQVSASCSMKRLQFHLWDPGSAAARELYGRYSLQEANARPGGGLKDRAVAILREVVGWPSEMVHVGEVPRGWFEAISDLYESVADELNLAAPRAAVGASASIYGQSMMGQGSYTADGIAGNPATGTLPYHAGRISYFGGPDDKSTYGRSPALTNEVAPNWSDLYYAAIRAPYVESLPHSKKAHQPRTDLTSQQKNEAVNWWRNRKLLVVHPAKGTGCVVRVADWGPAEWTGRIIDVSEHVLKEVLGGNTDNEVEIAFAPEGAQLGPYKVVAQTAEEARLLSQYGGVVGGMVARPDPIPAGTNPSSGDFAWGGYSNGNIPPDAMELIGVGNHRLHPLAARAFKAMRNEALKSNIDLQPSDSYRSFAAQQDVKRRKPNLAATPGRSNHGWGFALDMGIGGTFTSAAYRWLFDNGPRFGWMHPVWARPTSLGGNGSRPEAWHWEYWGIFGFQGNANVAALTGASGVAAQSRLLPEPTSAGAGGLAGSTSLFRGDEWYDTVDPHSQSDLLSGKRALMNDEPVIGVFKTLMGASMREFRSAPNGDFIAWFPDYFGQYGTAGKLIVEPLETSDFSVRWADKDLKTHQFVTTSLPVGGAFPSVGAIEAWQRYSTHGIASVDFPDLMAALFDFDDRSVWSDSRALLQRFSARIAVEEAPFLVDQQAAFWYAVHKFQRNWAEQFKAAVPLSFLPELYPGMLVRFPWLGLQMYCDAVTHSFSLSDPGGGPGLGFSTDATLIAPSRLEGGVHPTITDGLPLAKPQLAGANREVGGE